MKDYVRTGVAFAFVFSLTSFVHAQQPIPAERQRWNDTFKEYAARHVFEKYPPNGFLSKVLDGWPPGKALDIAMGQGRNALLMASRGWDVTGYDISDVAVDLARADASKRGLKLTAVVADARDYDYGAERFDPIAGIYVHGFLTARAADIVRSLKPGGILVVEGFHRAQVPFGYRSNELLETFGMLTILQYEEAAGTPDQVWTAPGEVVRFVRLVARKP